jgi:hypothetical protein
MEEGSDRGDAGLRGCQAFGIDKVLYEGESCLPDCEIAPPNALPDHSGEHLDTQIGLSLNLVIR